MSDTLQHVRNQRLHPPALCEPHEETSDEENTTEETDPTVHPTVPLNLADIGVPIPGPPNYRTSETFHHK